MFDAGRCAGQRVKVMQSRLEGSCRQLNPSSRRCRSGYARHGRLLALRTINDHTANANDFRRTWIVHKAERDAMRPATAMHLQPRVTRAPNRQDKI